MSKQVEKKTVETKAVEGKPAETQKSNLHKEIDRIVVDITKHSEHKKTTKSEIVVDVKEVKITGEDKKVFTALVVYLPFVYVKNHRTLLAKIVNEIQAKKKVPTFVLSQRTVIHKKGDFNQKIPRNRTLTSVYDSILDDLIAPGIVIGKRIRYHLDGSQHTKVTLNEESRAFIEQKTHSIAQIYKHLTNRKITFEFKPEPSYIQVPAIKAPRTKTTKKPYAKKDAQ